MSYLDDKITCGKCQTTFLLSLFNEFVNHKVWCNQQPYQEKKVDNCSQKYCAHCLFFSEDYEILFEHLQNVHGLQLFRIGAPTESPGSNSSYGDSLVDFSFSNNVQSPELPMYLGSQYGKYDILSLDSNANNMPINGGALSSNSINGCEQFIRTNCCIDGGNSPCENIGDCPRLFSDKNTDETKRTPVFISKEFAQSDYNNELGEIKDPESSTNEEAKSKYTCKHCFKQFKQKVHMRKHEIVMHGGERPFKCSFCTYKSVDSSHLRVHMRKHTGERPFECHVCEFKAAQNSTLKQHCAVKHPNNLFSCHKCNTKLFTKYENEKHLNSCDKTVNFLMNTENSQLTIKSQA